MSYDRLTIDTLSVARGGETTGDHEIVEDLKDQVSEFSLLFKALGHEGRLTILCHLVSGEKSVTELEMILGQRQAAVSQQLARLRLEGLVTTRRHGKAIYYALGDPKVRMLLKTLPELCCDIEASG